MEKIRIMEYNKDRKRTLLLVIGDSVKNYKSSGFCIFSDDINATMGISKDTWNYPVFKTVYPKELCDEKATN